jgi:hypothetical protein
MKFVEPWVSIDKDADALVAELERELPEKHVLYKKPVKALARRTDCDDVLFQICDSSEQFAIVHLTWSGKRDLHPNFPWTEIFKSFAEFDKNKMQPDALEFST